MNKKFCYYLCLSVMLLSACQKDDDDNPPSGNPPIVQAPGDGCYPNSVLTSSVNPLFTYHYLPNAPTILDYYTEHDPLSGQISHTYRYIYGTAIGGQLRLDSVFHYIGDMYMYPPGSFTDMTTYHYTAIDNYYETMDSARVHFYTYVDVEPFGHKGTIYYTYGPTGLLEAETYYDNPDASTGSFYDNYEMLFYYNANGQVTEWNYYNYNGVITYYERYELTSYFQPNFKNIPNPALAAAMLYAPSQLSVPSFGGGSGYVYTYQYQTNQHNYIVEQDLLVAGNWELIKLINYDCYY